MNVDFKQSPMDILRKVKLKNRNTNLLYLLVVFSYGKVEKDISISCQNFDPRLYPA